MTSDERVCLLKQSMLMKHKQHVVFSSVRMARLVRAWQFEAKVCVRYGLVRRTGQAFIDHGGELVCGAIVSMRTARGQAQRPDPVLSCTLLPVPHKHFGTTNLRWGSFQFGPPYDGFRVAVCFVDIVVWVSQPCFKVSIGSQKSGRKRPDWGIL